MTLTLLFQCTRQSICLLSLIVLLPLSVVQCTSSDEPTLLDQELGDLDVGGEGLNDEIEGLSDFIDEEESIAGLDGEDSLGSDEFGDEFGSDEFASEESGSDEFSDEFSSDEGGEIAGLDELDDSFDDFNEDEFAEFDEFDDFPEEGGNTFAQNEESLKNELNQAGSFEEYPVVENAQATFPEEVIGESAMDQNVIAPPFPAAQDGMMITSETQDIVAVAPNDNELPQDDLGVADPLVDEEKDPETRSWVPVVKVKTDPFFRNQRLMNAVYVARPKENFADISQKIYGEDRVADLRADNPHLEKGIDPGDKIYYNSSNRPDDKTQLKLYYEDIGLKPQYYLTNNGDNMRRLGLKLLGFPEGWKEIWAINQQVDSKTILPDNLNIKYWTGDESRIETPVAVNESPAGPEPTEVTSAGTINDPFGSQDFPEEPELPVEPPLPEATLAMPNQQLQPEVLPEIEPFPEQVIQPNPVVSQEAQNESLLSIGALALLLMAGVALVAIQIKKRKDNTGVSPHSLEFTQV